MWVPHPLRWLSNWRNGATLVASLLVALVAFVVIDASQARQDALDARNRTAATATRRIDKLNDRIEALGTMLFEQADANGQRIGELTAQVEALSQQVRDLGGTPIVVQPSASSSSSSQQPTTTTAPRAPSPTTTTTTTQERRCVVIVCV
jgi:hypothetical protein